MGTNNRVQAAVTVTRGSVAAMAKGRLAVNKDPHLYNTTTGKRADVAVESASCEGRMAVIALSQLVKKLEMAVLKCPVSPSEIEVILTQLKESRVMRMRRRRHVREESKVIIGHHISTGTNTAAGPRRTRESINTRREVGLKTETHPDLPARRDERRREAI